ncbi:hypothetical protein GJU41_11960 [Bacillus idriensis]|uniref:Replication protein n=1 Tax=Metabacillus idriensis TaxID=324768 RepID=A0A6I2M989_9BACI|nr:hypothetical protein [Metabacillus idriensis]MRX54688.1 hypothetical protein [Metabacillus idriensis]
MTIKIIDISTGENLSDQYTLRHRNQDEAFKRKQATTNERESNGRQRDFTASNMRNLHEVYDVLTTAQCGYLMLLQCYVGYDDGILIDAKKQPMTTADMMSVLQLDKKRATFYDFLSACINNDIIREIDGKYAVNSHYHFRGAFGNQFVVKSYTSKIKRVYREVKAADIGLIYRMLPYVHYETNALCTNPYEKDPSKIRWFNRKELAQEIGVDPATLGRRLPNMTFDKEYVVARIKVGSEPERYTFNPRVFYRKDGEPDATLIAMFNTDKV